MCIANWGSLKTGQGLCLKPRLSTTPLLLPGLPRGARLAPQITLASWPAVSRESIGTGVVDPKASACHSWWPFICNRNSPWCLRDRCGDHRSSTLLPLIIKMNVVINGSGAFSLYANGELMHIHGGGVCLPTWCPEHYCSAPLFSCHCDPGATTYSDLKKKC